LTLSAPGSIISAMHICSAQMCGRPLAPRATPPARPALVMRVAADLRAGSHMIDLDKVS
jgi:hypothetical protein